MMKAWRTLAAATLLAAGLPMQAQVKFDFDMSRRGQMMSEDHYGIFYEEINHAGDGGLYAELVRNRSFEDNAGNPDSWWTVGSASMSVVTDNMLNTVQKHAMRVDIKAANGGVRNEGFWGINVVSGREYKLSFWLRADDSYKGTITAQLQTNGGSLLGSAAIAVDATTEWKQYSAIITATGTDAAGFLALRGNTKGTIVLDVVSLFPPTFKNRPNGCRPDLAQKLADLHPRFMRFPGGCFIEGWASGGETNRFEWKKSVGPIEQRPGHMNLGWGYRVTDGLGYHELLQLAEDLGAAPMFVVNMGIGHDWSVDENDIGPFIQEALDAIEYANGSTDTFYGRMRAENGHPAPFNLKYLEIGNEQEFMLSREAYLRRYMQFYKAIKSRWPDLHLIADSYYFDNGITQPVELKDEHYYETPEFFINQYGRYDNQPSSSTKIYVGEYAVTQNCGWWGNMNAAIGEAVFMQGSENNSEAVTMMSYAPIFTHEEDYRWHPDMIRFNSSMSYGTPSYYVQRMFSNNVGKQNVRWTEEGNGPAFDLNKGSIGVGTWATSATFSGITVVASDTTFRVERTTASEWTTKNGAWTVSDTTFRQTNTTDTDVTCVFNRRFTTTNVDMTLHATKNGGSEGFLILFDYKDEQNYAWLNLGGWNNGQHAVEQCKNGTKTTFGATEGSLTTGKMYTVRIVKEGLHVVCYLDGKQIIDTNITSYADRVLYTSANIDDDKNMLYVKLVNPTGTAQTATLTFRNGQAVSGTAEVLSAPYGTDENTVTNPYYIVPRTQTVSTNGDGSVTFQCAAFSVNVLRLNVTDVVVPKPEALPAPRLRYSFDDGTTTDDSGRYAGTLMGQATVEPLADGNYVLVSGRQNEKSYMTIPVEAVKQAFTDVTDYTVSLNILHRSGNNLGNYCWAFGAANGTSQYIGLINAGGNLNWYVQLKNSSSTMTADSWSPLTVGEWHNLTYTQKDGVGRFYIDGLQRGTVSATVQPNQFISKITSASIGHSPFSADPVMENALFDNLQIFDTALTEQQVRKLAEDAASMDTSLGYDGLADSQELATLLKEVKNYYEDAAYEPLTVAYTAANRALSGTESLKRRRYGELVAAVDEYQQQEMEKARAGQAANLTFLITNSSFTRYNVGWQGLHIPAGYNGNTYAGYQNETGEQFNTGFDIWQQIDHLPEGYYTLSCSAFYRTGAIEPAWQAWQGKTPETMQARLYMNEESAPVVNLFSSDAYTYNPYTYPDNLASASSAFNTQKLYGENSLTVHVEEGASLRIGLRKLPYVASDWVAYDNFHLRYEGSVTDIQQNSVVSSPVVRTEYYSIDGRRTNALQRGIVILKQYHSDGSVTTQKRLLVR